MFKKMDLIPVSQRLLRVQVQKEPVSAGERGETMPVKLIKITQAY
jgi:hypothetical protein